MINHFWVYIWGVMELYGIRRMIPHARKLGRLAPFFAFSDRRSGIQSDAHEFFSAPCMAAQRLTGSQVDFKARMHFSMWQKSATCCLEVHSLPLWQICMRGVDVDTMMCHVFRCRPTMASSAESLMSSACVFKLF